MPDLIILRGVPGAGKSKLAAMLADTSDSAVVCSSDDYFMRGGTYVFQPEKLHIAHAMCYSRALAAMESGVERVILDNTNIEPGHFLEYEQAARRLGYDVSHIVVERRHNHRNQHGVSAEAVVRKARRLKETINL